MNLDHVAIVIRFDKKLVDDNNIVWEETYLKEFMYYGSGSANDAQKAMDKASELNERHKSPDRYFMAVREDASKAARLGWFNKEEDE